MSTFKAFLGAQAGMLIGIGLGTLLTPVLGPAGPVLGGKFGAIAGGSLAGGSQADDSIGPSGTGSAQNGGWGPSHDGGGGGLGW